MRVRFITRDLLWLTALIGMSVVGASLASPCSVSTSRSSIRTGGFPHPALGLGCPS
jgi:hypothetical protein